MAYLINTPSQQAAMLQSIGVPSLDVLLDQIPPALQLRRPLDLPPPLTEVELERHLRGLAAQNVGVSGRVCFLGGGVYDHFIPAVVDELVGRGEFYTAYTPYQAEASQGSLQAFFEYQSLICQLTGMDVANASLYEGASAVGEAVLMSLRVTDRTEHVVLVGGVHPETAQVVETYVAHLGCKVDYAPLSDGATDLARLRALVTDKTACVVVQNPNFLGYLERVDEVAAIARAQGALTVASFHPLSLGLLKRPADCGVDIAVAEGQSLGIPLQYGGPYLGVLACRSEYVRKMPGRLIGQTVDRLGRRCFVLNLQAREQHIRREKATSNICTNQGLLALRAAVHLSLLGPQGLREAAELCCRKAHYAAEQLARRPGIELLSARPFFQEFTIRCRDGAEAVVERARRAGCDVGPRLSAFPPLPGLDADTQARSLLVAVTECRTRAEIDRLVAAVAP